MTFRFFTFWFFLSFVFWGLHGYADCEATIQKLAPQTHQENLSQFKPWKIEARNLELTPHDLLPPHFIKEVEALVGPLRATVAFRNGAKNQIQIEARGKIYMKVALIAAEDDPNAVIIDNLTLQNPLKESVREGLNLDQSAKGLPLDVFKFANERLIELLKAGGYSKMVTNSQQHFGVMMLYQRVVGMRAKNEQVQRIIDEIEGLYRFARKELPVDLRPKSVEAFSALLGTASTPPIAASKDRALIIAKYFETGQLPDAVEVLKDKSDRPICFVFKDSELPMGSNILFINHLENSPKVFLWADVAWSHGLELEKKLN